MTILVIAGGAVAAALIVWAGVALRRASRTIESIVDDEVPTLRTLDHAYESWCTCDDCQGQPRTLQRRVD